ncbi:hypothetical protein HDU80_008543, partial [Chytriomyces hyalinus]
SVATRKPNPSRHTRKPNPPRHTRKPNLSRRTKTADLLKPTRKRNLLKPILVDMVATVLATKLSHFQLSPKTTTRSHKTTRCRLFKSTPFQLSRMMWHPQWMLRISLLTLLRWILSLSNRPLLRRTSRQWYQSLTVRLVLELVLLHTNCVG